MKKILLTILSVILLVCAGSAIACSRKGGGNYHALTFYKANGVTYVSSINSGKGFSNGKWEVKDGATVTFTVDLAADAVGDLVVYANDDVLAANDKGAYSVKVTADTDIIVDGIDAVGDYNRLTVASTPGVVVNFLNVADDGSVLKNGMMVRVGTVVQFSLTKGEGYYGTPVVYANDDVITPAGDVYSFKMSAPTKIKIEGIQKSISLTFNKGDNRVNYIGLDGLPYDTDTKIEVEHGDEIVFDLKISVYYDIEAGYEVMANTTIISPQSDGHYHVTIEDDITISVAKLVQDKAFIARKEGSGTKDDPYRLSRPIDLYEMAMRINDEFYTGLFSNDYYELEADIDLDGEQLFVIGDGNTGYSYFGGHFDGKGHTISNYYIVDTRIEQEEFNPLYLTNVGLFGYVMPGANRAPVIKNLKLDNFRITANANRTAVDLEDYTLCVGALAGATYGAQITNVSATNGRIQVTGGKDRGAYVGGLIGQQFAEFGSDTANYKFDSAVISCMTDVDISTSPDPTSYVYATGGISGALIVGDEHYTAYILNSYSKGDVEGGQNAGGIVGYAYNHSAVANCYSTGRVRSIITLSSDDYLESVYYATAGGIVGYAEYSSVISNSFSMGDVSAKSTKTGAKYTRSSGTVGAWDDNSALTNADSLLPTFKNLYGNCDSTITVNAAFINGLGWSDKDWIISSGLPKLNPDAAKPSITVNFSTDNQSVSLNPVTLDAYKSLAGWGVDGVIEEFVGSGTCRSYGYFFDAELEHKVPRSFVITSDTTLYVGYADYTQVTGIYYLGDSVREVITLELTDDGKAVYRDGALNQTGYYSWDGETLIIYYSVLGVLTDLEFNSDLIEYYFGSYYIFTGKIEGDVLSIYGGDIDEIEFSAQGPYYTGNVIYLFDDPLHAYKKVDGFQYGSYYFGSGEYTFFGNRTGIYISGGDEKIFTYQFGDNKLTLTFDGGTEEATVDGNGYVTAVKTDSVTPFDEFKGTWEKSYETDKKYTFDGKNKWTYNGYGTTDTGSYSVDGGVLNAGSFTAKIVDGLLVITSGGKEVTYYREGSFTGQWYFNGVSSQGFEIAVGITFGGIDEKGYGTALVEYSTGTQYEVTYEYSVENDTKFVLLFHEDLVFGELVYSDTNLTLVGKFDGQTARFTAYDALIGKWVTDSTDITSLEFNGGGFYNGIYELDGDRVTGSMSVKGTVRVNGGSRVNYTLNRTTQTGSFTYNSVVYSISYNETTGLVDVTPDGGSVFHLALPDSWSGRELKDGAGNIYTFDGRGGLPDGGKISVSNGDSYNYKISDGDITVTGGTFAKGIHDGHSVFVLTVSGDSKYLTYNTPFIGEWVVGGVSGTLTIGEIYADDTATASYTLYKKSAIELNLTYNADENYLTYEVDNTVYSITISKVGSNYQLSFEGVNGSVACIPEALTDEMKGKVFFVLGENGNPDGREIVFDGLGEYTYANGTAVVLGANGVVEETFIYRRNTYGDWTLIYNYNNYVYNYVLVGFENNNKFDGEVLFSLIDGEGKYYAAIVPDGFYNFRVKDADNADAYYVFNGYGSVKFVSGGTTVIYGYELINSDATNYKYTFKFTDNNSGEVFTAVLDLSVSEDRWNIKKTAN